MKQYFYLIVIDVFYYPKGEEEHVNKFIETQKESRRGIMDIEAKEDKPSLIYDKIFKYVMHGWKDSSVIRTIVTYFNFWEEKEIPIDFVDIPIEDWDISAGLMSELKKLQVRTYKDIYYFGDDVLPLHLGRKNLIELKSFLETKGIKLPK